MRAGLKPDSNVREQDAVAEAGMILMDQSFKALAIDNGAMSIFAALREHKRKLDSASECPPAALVEEIRELMQGAHPAGPASWIVHLPMGEFAYTGRTYCLEPQNGFSQPLMVLYLKRNVSAKDFLDHAGFEYRLTDRERETLMGMVLGLTNKELAQRMDISTSTAKAFVRMVMAKMGVAKRAAVVAKVLEHTTIRSMSGTLQLLLCVCLLSAFLHAQPSPVAPACAPPLCVSRADDNAGTPGPGTLRFAVGNAPAGSVITFDPALDGKTISLDTSSPGNQLRVVRDLTIQGPGADELTISGGNATRIFFIDGGAIRIAGLTLANGLAKGGDGGSGTGGGGGGGGAAGMGGAIFLNSGSLTLSGVVIRANRAVGGTGGYAGTGSGSGSGGGGGGSLRNGSSPGQGGMGDLGIADTDRAGLGGPGGASECARVTGGDSGFGGGAGGGGSCARGPGEGGGRGFGGGRGGAGGFMDADGTASFPSGGAGGAGLGGAIFARSGFVELIDSAFLNNSAQGGLGAPESSSAPAKGGAVFLCTAALCGPGYNSAAVWSGSTHFAGNTADSKAGQGCLGRHDEEVCGLLSSSHVAQLALSAPGATHVGTPFAVVVTALDSDGIPVVTYGGTVHVTTSDRKSIVPSDTQLAAGTNAFRITLQTEGTQTITASDASGASISGSSTIEVTPAGT